jgi:hypothetical protein
METAATLPVGVAGSQHLKRLARAKFQCYFHGFIYSHQLRLKNVQCATIGRHRDTARLVTGLALTPAIGSAAVTEPLVFADEAAILAEAEAAAISTSYLTSIEEVIEHVKAADTLGFGFRVESYVVSALDEPGTSHPEFEFTLLEDMPERLDSAAD